jgi:hypothetical protein
MTLSRNDYLRRVDAAADAIWKTRPSEPLAAWRQGYAAAVTRVTFALTLSNPAATAVLEQLEAWAKETDEAAAGK